MLADLEDIVSATDAQTLVLELGQRSSTVERRVAEWADARGLRLVRRTRLDACTAVCGNSALAGAVRRIACRYPVLRERLLNRRGELIRDHEHWRHLRPLVVAFVLAHAFAAKSVIKAFGGEIPPHPPSEQHDSRIP